MAPAICPPAIFLDLASLCKKATRNGGLFICLLAAITNTVTAAWYCAPMPDSPYTLHHGNCLDVLPTLPAGSVDAVICDPPYGTTACAWDSVIPFEPMWAGINRVTCKEAAILLFAVQPFLSALVASNLSQFRYQYTWLKNQPTGVMNCKYMPMKLTENVVVFSKLRARSNQFVDEKMNYFPQGLIESGITAKGKSGASAINNTRGDTGKDYIRTHTNYPTDILRFDKLQQSIHPTQKPVALLEYLIRTYTNEGDTVLDFTMGSGSCGVAAMRTGRRFIGVEMDAGYFEIASGRIANAAGEFVPTAKEMASPQLSLLW